MRKALAQWIQKNRLASGLITIALLVFGYLIYLEKISIPLFTNSTFDTFGTFVNLGIGGVAIMVIGGILFSVPIPTIKLIGLGVFIAGLLMAGGTFTTALIKLLEIIGPVGQIGLLFVVMFFVFRGGGSKSRRLKPLA